MHIFDLSIYFLKNKNVIVANSKFSRDGNRNSLTLVFFFIADRKLDGMKLTKNTCRTSFKFLIFEMNHWMFWNLFCN